MCQPTTITCPSCNTSRTTLVPCGPPRSSLHGRPRSSDAPAPAPPPPPTPSLLACPLTPAAHQHLLATCAPCTAAYRVAYDKTLRASRSIAMERAASAQSTITNTSVSSGDEMEWDGPGNTVNIVMPTVATVPAVRGTRMPETAGEEDPHTRFLNESKEWSRNVWERYEKGEVERLCRRRGVKENDMVYA